jgi:hypothetical protein
MTLDDDALGSQPELSQLQGEVAAGFDMEKFKQSTVGRYFAWRASEAILDGLEALKVADPFQPHSIVEIQSRIRVAEQFFGWMEACIESGKAAAQQLDTREQVPVEPV